jgi:hypothetical protein
LLVIGGCLGGCQSEGPGKKTRVSIGSPFVIEVEETVPADKDSDHKYIVTFDDWAQKFLNAWREPKPDESEVAGPPAPEVEPVTP